MSIHQTIFLAGQKPHQTRNDARRNKCNGLPIPLPQKNSRGITGPEKRGNRRGINVFTPPIIENNRHHPRDKYPPDQHGGHKKYLIIDLVDVVYALISSVTL